MGILGTATVIRGKGACELFINDIRDEEVHRINELHAKEMAIVMNELKKTKDRMHMMPVDMYKKEKRAETLINLKLGIPKRPSLGYKIRETIAFAWAYIWYYGVKWDVWGYWDDEEHEDARREFSQTRQRR